MKKELLIEKAKNTNPRCPIPLYAIRVFKFIWFSPPIAAIIIDKILIINKTLLNNEIFTITINNDSLGITDKQEIPAILNPW